MGIRATRHLFQIHLPHGFDELDLTVSSWADVADEMDGLNRSEMDELELQLQEPVWGEYQEK